MFFNLRQFLSSVELSTVLDKTESAVTRCQKRKKYKNLPGPHGHSITAQILKGAAGLEVQQSIHSPRVWPEIQDLAVFKTWFSFWCWLLLSSSEHQGPQGWDFWDFGAVGAECPVKLSWACTEGRAPCTGDTWSSQGCRDSSPGCPCLWYSPAGHQGPGNANWAHHRASGVTTTWIILCFSFICLFL